MYFYNHAASYTSVMFIYTLLFDPVFPTSLVRVSGGRVLT